MPERIQRKRTKGWKMPPECVYVGRPTVFGNPWTVKSTLASGLFMPEFVADVCVKEFRAWVLRGNSPNGENHGLWRALEDAWKKLVAALPTLRGKDLACWCPVGSPCHADVLLELANA